MITEIYKKNIKDVYKTSIVQQTAFWSEVKRKLGLNTTAIDFKVKKNELLRDAGDNSSINGDILIIIRRIDNNNSIAYVPYGPELEPEEQRQGLYKFKSGFGGKVLHTLGCWDYPVDQEKYNVYRSIELTQKGYHEN